MFEALAVWDGGYETGSAGALAFELVAARLIEHFVPRRERAMLGAVRHGIELLAEQLDSVPPNQVGRRVLAALAEARPEFRRLGNWGSAHRLRLAHPLARLPLVGKPWSGTGRSVDWPWPGSNESLLKPRIRRLPAASPRVSAATREYVRSLGPQRQPPRHPRRPGRHAGQRRLSHQAELFRRGAYIEVAEPRHGAGMLPPDSDDGDTVIDMTSLLRLYARLRRHQLERQNPAAVQRETLLRWWAVPPRHGSAATTALPGSGM